VAKSPHFPAVVGFPFSLGGVDPVCGVGLHPPGSKKSWAFFFLPWVFFLFFPIRRQEKPVFLGREEVFPLFFSPMPDRLLGRHFCLNGQYGTPFSFFFQDEALPICGGGGWGGGGKNGPRIEFRARTPLYPPFFPPWLRPRFFFPQGTFFPSGAHTVAQRFPGGPRTLFHKHSRVDSHFLFLLVRGFFSVLASCKDVPWFPLLPAGFGALPLPLPLMSLSRCGSFRSSPCSTVRAASFFGASLGLRP